LRFIKLKYGIYAGRSLLIKGLQMSSRNEVLARLITEYMQESKFKLFAFEVLKIHFSLSSQIEVVPLFEVISDIKSGKLLDFIYDRPSELVLYNIDNIHPTITAGLFFAHQSYELKPKELLGIKPFRARQKAVKQSRDHKHTIAYLNTYGVYRSSLSQDLTLQVGENFNLNGQEKQLFNGYRKIRLGQAESPEIIYGDILKKLI